jgi:hypothetical protein
VAYAKTHSEASREEQMAQVMAVFQGWLETPEGQAAAAELQGQGLSEEDFLGALFQRFMAAMQ